MRDDGQTHVMPISDMREHTLNDCWCDPVQDELCEDVYRHTSLDHREDFEDGVGKLN